MILDKECGIRSFFFFVLLGHLILNALHPTYTPVSINCGAKGNGKKKWGVVMNNLRQESVTCVLYLYQHVGFILNWSHMLNKREIGFQLYCFCFCCVSELAWSGRKNAVFLFSITLHIPVFKKGLQQVLRIDLTSFSKQLAPVITLITYWLESEDHSWIICVRHLHVNGMSRLLPDHFLNAKESANAIHMQTDND